MRGLKGAHEVGGEGGWNVGSMGVTAGTAPTPPSAPHHLPGANTLVTLMFSPSPVDLGVQGARCGGRGETGYIGPPCRADVVFRAIGSVWKDWWHGGKGLESGVMEWLGRVRDGDSLERLRGGL